jgi:hypothetical protein
MANPTISSILNKTRDPELVQKLTETLTTSELNSLLLEVFRMKAQQITPSELMNDYIRNRFVQPSALNAITLLYNELTLLTLAEQGSFSALEISPLAPLGNCSVLGLVDQNKVVSALRGTEAVADATNLLALEAMHKRKSTGETDMKNYCCVHRHVRAQTLPPIKDFTAHFKIFAAVTVGRDTGSFGFEKESLLLHLKLYRDYLDNELRHHSLKIILKVLEGQGSQEFGSHLFDFLRTPLQDVDMSVVQVPKEEHRYYQHLRFSINAVHVSGKETNLCDGGFVDWAQKLSSNKKERMLTSGLGLELMLKIKEEALG